MSCARRREAFPFLRLHGRCLVFAAAALAGADGATAATAADSQGPTGTVVINGGSAYTRTTAVTLSLSATDDASAVTQMSFSNSGTFWSAPERFAATKAWRLTSTPGTKTVYARFRDAAGNWSAAASATIVLDATAPTISSVASSGVTGTTATITWTTNEGATSQVEYGVTTATLTPRDTALVTAHAVVLRSLASATTYSYRPRSIDAAGNERVGPVLTFRTSTSADVTPPTVPTGLTATGASVSRIDVRWTAAADDTGVAGYRVYREGSLAATVAATSFSDTGLSPATTHTYAVSAYDAAGNASALSSPAVGATLPDTTPPSVPTGLAAVAVSARRIDLAWSASTDDVGVTDYDVYRGDVRLAVVGAPAYSDDDLDPRTSYTYTVAARDAAGNLSGRSLPASATTFGLVAVSPATATVGIGGTATFSCTLDDPLDTSCSWAVLEGSTGGSAVSVGAKTATYTAPAVPGTYHVVATGSSDPTHTAAATVTVVAASTPTLVQNVSSSTNPVGIGIDGNDFKFTLPNAVLAGNALVLKVAYESGASFAATPVTDSNGNVWPAAPSAAVADRNGNVNLAVFVLPNARPGLTTLTVHFTTPVRPFQYDCGEWRNVDTAAPVAGSVGASGVAGPTVSAGVFTPQNNDAHGGNLVLYYVHTDDSPGSGNSASSIAAGGGFTLLDADIAWGRDTNSYHASAYLVQPTAAAIDPSVTVTTAPGTEHFVVLAIALKAAAAGTAPAPGIRIVKMHHFTNEVPPTAWNIQFPTTGSNLIVAVTPNAPGNGNTTIGSVTDNHGNTYRKTQPAADQPQWWVAEGATTAADTRLTVSMNAGSAGLSMRVFEITGAASSSVVDAAAGMSATKCDSLTSITRAPSITPASANGLTIATMALGQGPGLAVDGPAGAVFDLVTYAGELDTDTMENADAMGHVYNTTTTTQDWSWRFTSRPANSCHASAIHLRAP
jgi:chitodextrinase